MTTVRFFAASCQYPAGLVEEPVSFGSMRRLHRTLAACVQAGEAPAVFSLGDLVYVDATAGLFDAYGMADRYGGPYSRLGASADYRQLRAWAGARFFATPDDHELHENWVFDRKDPRSREARIEGMHAFVGHLGPNAAGALDGRGRVVALGPPGWTAFLADTRLYRARRSAANAATAPLLRWRQRERLRAWLTAQQQLHPDRPKFVLCPALLLPRRLGLADEGPAGAVTSDGWDSYPASLAWLLDLVAGPPSIRHLVVVSGDEHLAMLCRARVRRVGREADWVTVHSVHCPALHAPYPFANARPADFATLERFVLPDPRSGAPLVECVVEETAFPPVREGFVSIRASVDGASPVVEVGYLDGWNYDADEPPPGPDGRLEGDRLPVGGSGAHRQRVADLARARALRDKALSLRPDVPAGPANQPHEST